MRTKRDILDVLDPKQIHDLLEQLDNIEVTEEVSIAKRHARGENTTGPVRWFVYHRAKEVHFLMGAEEAKGFTSILDALECAYSPANQEKWAERAKR